MIKTVMCRKPVPYHYAVKLLDVPRHTLYSLGGTPLVATVSGITTAEEVCADVQSVVLERLIQEEERAKRSRYLPERKRPWFTTKTKTPFSDAVEKKARSHTLKDELKVATIVTEKLGEPWKPSRRGRKPLYDPKKLAAAILVKETRGMSFERLAAELKNQGCDLRTEEAKREEGEACSPCPSQLHWAMSKIPKEYLERVLELLDQMVAEEHKKLFGEKCLLEYSIDSTDDTCTTLKETMVAMRVELHHQTVKYNVLARLVTNTIVAVCASKNTKDARRLLQYVPPGSPVYMDAEYDVEYNYQYSQERRITIRVYPKLYGEKPYKGKHRRRPKKIQQGEV